MYAKKDIKCYSLRELLKKNAALILTLLKTGLTSLSPRIYDPKVKTFGTFGKLLCILIHPIFWKKVSQNFWI